VRYQPSALSMHSFRLNYLARVVAWILAAGIVALSVVPPELRPETAVPHYFEHFLAYALMGMAFGLGYKSNQAMLAIFLTAFCALIEIVQLFVPGRHARLLDFATDTIAVCLGVALASAVAMLHGRFKRGA
jgi:VanZ family protein